MAGRTYWSLAGLFSLLLAHGWAQQAPPPNDDFGIRITEFLARGTKTATPPGEWVELYNASGETRDLSGYRLLHEGDLHVLPDLRLRAGAYTVIQPEFRIRGSGGSFTLTDPQGDQVIAAIDPDYPAQFTGVSYGMSPGGDRAFFQQPTPGAPNGNGYAGVCAEPEMSRERGFYDQPIRVALRSKDPAVTIRYTLDGSTPSVRHGAIYQRDIPVRTTTTLRAIALRDGYLASRVVTHTYLYIDHIIRQPAKPQGFPTQWGHTGRGHVIPGDYEMDPRVTRKTLPGYGIREALLDLPTVSVVMPIPDLFDDRTGIYAHTQRRGPAWERAMSMEWIDPNGGEGFQVNAGIRMQGNSSRRPERMQKHSFRVDFQSQYGVKKLRFPVYPDSPVREFNKLVLRTPSTDSWALTGWMVHRYRPNDFQYIRDVWMKESMRAMGHPSSRSRFVHLYLNGLYWGIYILAERLDEHYFASHLGGLPEDWDIIRDFSEVLAGDRRTWQQLSAQAQQAYDPQIYQRFLSESPPLHLQNFADYMLLHFFADAEDWPHHNFYAAAHRRGDHPFRFLVWDQEIVLDNHDMNRMTTTEPGPGLIFHGLMRQDAFRHLFADRVHHHLSPGGALSLKACQDRYHAISQIVDKAVVAESARWGDTAHRTPYALSVPRPRNASDHDDPYYPAPVGGRAPYMTREASWLVERENVMTNYLPDLFDLRKSSAFLNKLRAHRLYPRIDPPIIHTKTDILTGQSLATIALSNPNSGGDIHYTTDGSDPRIDASRRGDTVALLSQLAPKRAIVPKNGLWDRGAVTWRDPKFDDSRWPQGTLGAGYEQNPSRGYRALIDPRLDVKDQVTRASNECIYLRARFQVEDPKVFSKLVLGIRYDDGYIAYINGREVSRSNVSPNTAPRWNMPASTRRDDRVASAFEQVDISPALRLLEAGDNVLAVHAVNDDPGSSDFLIHPVLEGVRPATVNAEDAVKGTRYTDPIVLKEPATIRAAVKRGDAWSALVTKPILAITAATSGNLIVSEIMYHPEHDGSTEFVEIMNVSSTHAIALSAVSIEDGIEFVFPETDPLHPGDCALLVKDLESFRRLYGSGPKVAGIYKKSLSNGGDTIVLKAAGGGVIEKFSYKDETPWPASADGQGPSLERRLDDASACDHPDRPASWQPSLYHGGSPGHGVLYQ